LNDIHPAVKVFTESSLADGIFQLVVGGGDESDIDFNRVGTAEAHEGAFFRHAQDFGLDAGGHVADFVEKNGTAAGAFEQSFFAPAGVGERSGLVTEEFAF
jgi:hypothetical protein